MKRTAKYALMTALVSATVVPAIAQSDTPFPDTKENHWAYEAVTRLKADGILVGYPNGNFIGGRLATRYEMAVAINAAYMKLKTITGGLGKQIDEINTKITDLQNRKGEGVSDIDSIKSSLADIKDMVGGMKSYGEDITNLKKLTDKFEKDLVSIGVDVDDVKKGLDSLGKRVSALESHALPIHVYGSFDTFSANGYSTSGYYGVDQTGRPLGFGRGSSFGHPEGVGQDFTFMNEWMLGFKTTADTGAKADVQIVASNMLGGIYSSGLRYTFAQANGVGFGSQGVQIAGINYQEPIESLYVQKAVIGYDWTKCGITGAERVGRIPVQLGSYILQRPDFTPYFSNPRWDDGNYDIDGMMVAAKIGGIGAHLVAGRTSTATDTTGTLLQPMLAGRSYAAAGGVVPLGVTAPLNLVNQMFGLNVSVPIGRNGDDLSLNYLMLGSNTFATDASFTGSANRVNDYGADAHVTLGPIKAWGGYSKTDVYQNTHSLLTKNNSRATGYLGYDAAKWGVSAGYRYIEPYYGAPGAWGRIGMWFNPTDIEGLDACGHLDIMGFCTLKGTYEYYTGTGKVAGGLTTNDKIMRYTASLEHKLDAATSLNLGFEQDDWNLVGNTGKPHERWYTIGAKHDFSDKTSMSVSWLISDYNGQNQPGFTLFSGTPGGNTIARGGLITTQFTVKF